MTTATAGSVAGHSGDKDKDKVEKRRALGRGLDSLLPGPRAVASSAVPGPGAPTRAPIPQIVRSDQSGSTAAVNDSATTNPAAPVQLIAPPPAAQATENSVMSVAISDIDRNPFQTRHVGHDQKLEELAESIKANGVVQPILLRPAEEEGRYVLILGERRLHASKKAGKTHIPAIVRQVSPQQAAEMTIIENLQREDLSVLEQAEAFRVLSRDFHLTQQQIGERVGLSRESVANYMRLLKLPAEVLQLLAEKKITFAEAKELLKLQDDDQITKAALYAVKHNLTGDQIERLVLAMSGLADPFPGMPGHVVNRSGARWVDPNVRAAQMELERMLGLRVRIRDRKGKGKIVIEYSTVDDYERVVEALKGTK